MNIDEFLKKLKSCYKSNTYGYDELKVSVNPERTKFCISAPITKSICTKCGTDLTKVQPKLYVEFHEKQESLSVFQVNLLWFLWKWNKIPYDYAQYHKCVSGQKFIGNIKEVKNEN